MNITKYPGIYVHIPFCQVKCGYCDFYSESTFNQKEQFLNSLTKEIKFYKSLVPSDVNFDTIYVGGGTPSVLEPAELSEVLDQLKDAFNFNSDTEITLEINPGTVDCSTLKQLHQFGFTRLSIGVQSFLDHELKILGRIHTARQAKSSILDAREAGFDSISIDLIYALPNQTMDDWTTSLETGVQFSPEHISTYNLIYEQNTPFYEKLMSGDFMEHDNDTEARFFTETSALLTKSGFQHYEISNYANSDLNVSRHNYKYWTHTPYLSFGPSAHSFWNNKRWSNVRSIKKYIAMVEKGQKPVDFEEQIDSAKLSDEYIMLRLRTQSGIDMNDYTSMFNKDFNSTYETVIENLIKENFAVIDNDHFKLTTKGLLVCDEISPKFTV